MENFGPLKDKAIDTLLIWILSYHCPGEWKLNDADENGQFLLFNPLQGLRQLDKRKILILQQ